MMLDFLHIDPARYSIHAWIRRHKLKNEKGDLIEFKNHPYLFDIYRDNASELVVMKAAQVGLSTAAVIKNLYDVWSKRIEVIYTLATDHDAASFVSGKVDRIIANNPVLRELVAQKDSVEQKAVGNNMIHFRGTHTKKAAITIPADRLVHDEKDSSKLDVINEYQSRLQHSKRKQTHTFSHPSLPDTGIHADWLKSDQKHWHVVCPRCKEEQFLEWNTEDPRKMSIDMERKTFVCKKCHGTLDDKTRAGGHWKVHNPKSKVSGYWVPLLIAPWVSATDIVAMHQNPNTTKEFFYTKVLGLPYADGTAKLLYNHFTQNLTSKRWGPDQDERVVIGVDTGRKIDYVMGNERGLFAYGDCEDYDTLDAYMKRFPRAIAIVDEGGDLIGSRKFYEKWRGRIFFCALLGDRATKELVSWKTGDEHGMVTADRNRMIQFVIDHFRDKRLLVHGTENEWYEYWLDWNNLSRRKVLDPDTNQIKGYKFVRSGRDHLALATVFWMVGMDKFSKTGNIYLPALDMPVANSYMINPDGTVSFDPNDLMKGDRAMYDMGVQMSLDALEENGNDWRNY